MKKNAFTLAEVLITLVIIGVIAAMTIPTLMGSTNEQEYKSKVKKIISSINQAMKLDYALYGNDYQRYGGDPQVTARVLSNHLSVIEYVDLPGEVFGDPNSVFLKLSDGAVIITGSWGVMVDVDGDKNGLASDREGNINCNGHNCIGVNLLNGSAFIPYNSEDGMRLLNE